MLLLQAALVTGLIAVHLFAGHLKFLHGIPRSRWLSGAGGASVAYVFMHLLPELELAQAGIVGDAESRVLDRAAYLIALTGLVAFYALERQAKQERKLHAVAEGDLQARSGQGVFWLHMTSFAIYNAIIGYLLVQGERQDAVQELAFFVAMALHFLVTDYGLREDHKEAYQHIGRWVLATAILAGWLLGLVYAGGERLAHLLFAFVAGGVVLNVLKEELPEERESRLAAFIVGAFGYAALLLWL